MKYLWDDIYSGGSYLLMIIFGAVAVSMTFAEKGNRRWQLLQWLATAVIALGLGMTAGELLNRFTEFISVTSEKTGAFALQALYFAATVANVIFNVIPAAIATTSAVRICKGKKSTITFFMVLFMLLAASIQQFFAQITYVFFSPGNDGYFRDYPSYPVRYLIDVLWLAAVILIYHKVFRKKLTDFLEYAQEQIEHIILVPLLSYLAFELVVGTLSTYSITVMTIEAGTFLIALITTVSMIFIYILMFWAIFKAVTVAAGSAKVKAELDVASKIQLSALPNKFPAFPKRNDVDIYAAMHPAREVGGDFYDFFFIDEDHLAVLIADVSGKGVPAALFMMSGRAIIRNQALLGIDPGEIFTNANRQLAENNKESMFITAFLGIMNVKTGEFRFCNAGHNTPYRSPQKGEVVPFQMNPGFVLAGLKRTRYQTEVTHLEAGEKLILYTDGVTEAVDKKMNMYMEPRLEKTLKECIRSDAQETVEKIVKSVYDFSLGAEQADDITVLCVSWKEA